MDDEQAGMRRKWMDLGRDVVVGLLLAAIVVAVVLMSSSTPPSFVYAAF